MPFALNEQGVREIDGPGDDPRIVAYLQTTTLPGVLAMQDETPWCSAFVNWCLRRADVEGTHSAAARSWLHWGKAIETPRRGCIAVLSREGGGHVGFYLREWAGHIQLLGGNQGNAVGVRSYERSRLLGYRVPA